jgi:hypothetical protein
MAWATDEFQSDTYFQSLTFKPSPCSFYVGNFSDDALILAYQIKKNLKLINHDLYRVSGVNSLSAKYFQTISRFSFDVRSSQHITDGFIPCRIFKNCSYGRGVITNSEAIHNAFNKLIPIYKDADDFIDVSDKYSCGYFDNQLREASFYIQKNHTYLNRIRDLFHIIGV